MKKFEKFENSKNVEEMLIAEIEKSYIPEQKDIDQLGLTIKGDLVTFKSWAPLADSVRLLLYKNPPLNREQEPDASFEMSSEDGKGWDWKGIWVYTLEKKADFNYYLYEITNFGKTGRVADIWAYAASGDSIASQIADINSQDFLPKDWEEDYTNPWGSTGTEQKNYSQALIYEMHVRDWAKGLNPNLTGNSGCYAQLTAALKEGAVLNDYLKSLCISHVQLLPIFDHVQKNAEDDYNWGYNPYNYNVVEGRYCLKAKEKATSLEGNKGVKEVRALIKGFHDAGRAVNMDVVYNHTSGTGEDSIYDLTVPYYFYRFNEDGSYSNGSGCGNEIASGRTMVKAFIIKSLKHWMQDFHVNGFRFDLMGCLEMTTMEEIYAELYKIDKNVMVYGEPWTGGPSRVVKGANITNGGSIKDCPDVACFDNVFRDAIKGAEFGGFAQGQVQGKCSDEAIVTALTGSKEKVSKVGQYINYVECHDNYTLFDKLAISSLGLTSFSGDLYEACRDKIEEIKKQDILAAAYIILAQGTPFLNGGQEFMRSKRGDENSYISGDDVNAIDLNLIKKNADLLQSYRGLLALRKVYSKYFGCNPDAKAETVKEGITQYTTGPFTVIFNATNSDYTYCADSPFFHFAVKDLLPQQNNPVADTWVVAAKSFEVFYSGR